MMVKAPLVLEIINLQPYEVTMHTPKHPVSIKKLKKVDPAMGETTAAAVMERGGC